MTSILSLATKCPFDTSFAQELLDLVSLFVAHGADLNDEVYTVLEIASGVKHMQLTELWRGLLYSCSQILIMGHSASSVLAIILKSWRLEECPQMDWLSDPQEMAKSGFVQSHPIALIVTSKDMREDKQHWFAPDLFVADDIFPLASVGGLDEDLLPLLHLVDDEIQGQGMSLLERQGLRNDTYWDEDILYPVIIPPEAEAGVDRAVKQLRSTKVPVAERRKEVRRRLGICTPLEKLM